MADCALTVGEVSLADSAVRELLAQHQRDMDVVSPPGTSFALDLSELAQPGISIFGARESGRLIAVGALKRLDPDHAEIKSMRTHADHLGKGAAQSVLEHILGVAGEEGLALLSLETGTSADFAPAIALYRKNGFIPGESFAGYVNGPHNQCYHRPLYEKNR